jgi:hypothetical protein
LALVAVSGDQIWVKAGTYKPTSGTDRSISFVLKNGVAIYGGFNGTETLLSQRNPAANVAILSGEIGAAGTSDNSFHVVIGSGTDSTAVLDGFTVTAGNATSDKGGGMWNYGGSPTLRNMIFDANSADYGGGMYNEINSSPVLTYVTFSNNQVGDFGDGAGMYNSNNSNPILTHVTFSNNQTGANGNGGGIYSSASNPTLENVTFSSNVASYGAGMANDGSAPTLLNVTFNANLGDHGGAMSSVDSNPTLTDVTFTGNSGSIGGAFFAGGGSATLTNVIFSDNSAPYGKGGAIFNYSGNLTLTNVTFIGNTSYEGGGMHNYIGASATLTDVTFNGNSATYGGGMVNFYYSSPKLTRVTFIGNTAANSGGGISDDAYSETALTDVTFSNNSAPYGGGMYNEDNSPKLVRVTFNGNTAMNGGGGIYNHNNTPTLTNVTFHNNSAPTGGGMYNDGSLPTLTNVTFSGNTATSSTGGMYNTYSNPYIYNSVFWNNGSEIYNNFSNPTIADSIVSGGCPSSSTCTHIINANPLLGPLQDNGGFTQTMALGPGSPAIDAGNDANCPSTDQRGVTRPQGSHCDMGAYESTPPIITGNVGVSGTTLNYTGGSTVADSNGNYSISVPYQWSGTVTPGHTCYTFNPPSRSYNQVTTNQTGQNFTATFNAASGCANINVSIGGTSQGTYGVPPQGSQRVTYPVDSGPVKLYSTNAVPIIAALRDAFLVGGQVESFSQLMGLPREQLSDTYYFPAYNNLTLSGQLRFANVDTIATNVTVTIGGVDQGTYPLQPSESKRISYPLDTGPVVIKSSNGAKIIAALRDAFFVNNRVESFVQLMGLPKEQLSDTYYFPAYNNLSLSGQLRFANVDSIDTIVTVTIGGVDQGTYALQPNQSQRVSYPLDTGPVVITSSNGAKIIAALRDAYLVGGKVESFSQLMGLPLEALSDSYVFPAYNNLTLSGQLRFANVDNIATDVTITIGGQAQPIITLQAGESQRVTYPLDSGPVVVESSNGAKIIVALRDAFFVNNRVVSFVQLMGLPQAALSDTFYFPAYNNLTLSGQLRFGVP